MHPMQKSLDRIDFEIIRLLRDNARISNKQIAAKVGLAPSTCLSRVRNLRQQGTLRGFHAHVNAKHLGVGLQAMIAVRLKRQSHEDVESFRHHALNTPEVNQLYHVAGSTDFLVHVWARDSEHLRELAMRAFADREEVAHIETGLIFEHAINAELPSFLDWNNDEKT